MTWNSSRWDSSRGLLDRDLLVILVHCLVYGQRERPFALAGATVPNANIVDRVLVDGPFLLPTFLAEEYHDLELREDVGPPGDYA